MSNKKVIKGLKCLLEQKKTCEKDCPYFIQVVPGLCGYCAKANVIKDAIALLQEQEPVIPENGKCPECGYTVHRINYDGPYNGIRHEWFRFCPSCGRLMDWDT